MNGETTNAILQGCRSLIPELLAKDGSFEVLRVQCGLRPAREVGRSKSGSGICRWNAQNGTFVWSCWRWVGHFSQRNVVNILTRTVTAIKNAIGNARKVVKLVKRFDSMDEHDGEPLESELTKIKCTARVTSRTRHP